MSGTECQEECIADVWLKSVKQTATDSRGEPAATVHAVRPYVNHPICRASPDRYPVSGIPYPVSGHGFSRATGCSAAGRATMWFRPAQRSIDQLESIDLETTPKGRLLATSVPSDLDIAQAATTKPISEIAASIGINEDELIAFGTTNPLSRHNQLP